MKRYFCDYCKEEIPYSCVTDMVSIKLLRRSGVTMYDVCYGCAEEIDAKCSFLAPNDKSSK